MDVIAAQRFTLDGVRRAQDEEFNLDLPPAEIQDLRDKGLLKPEPVVEAAPEAEADVDAAEQEPKSARRRGAQPAA